MIEMIYKTCHCIEIIVVPLLLNYSLGLRLEDEITYGTTVAGFLTEPL
jgi:hypothetical protein